MREIKFRAYERDLQIMVYGDQRYGELYYDCNPAKSINITLNEDGDRYNYMEYTGVTDVKGNEIYEGDIVRALYNTDCQSRFKGKVIFNDGAFLLEDDKGMVELLYNLKEYCTLEVVGNAYEEENGGQNND